MPVPAGNAGAIAGDWLLTEPASAYAITLRIDGAPTQLAGHYSLQLTGRSAVNTYFATASFSQGPSIESGEAGTGGLSDLGATKMAGSPAAMQFENTYFERLRAVNKAELAGNDRLRLSYGGPSSGVLVYKRQ